MIVWTAGPLIQELPAEVLDAALERVIGRTAGASA
jgi:hypothetical protein